MLKKFTEAALPGDVGARTSFRLLKTAHQSPVRVYGESTSVRTPTQRTRPRQQLRCLAFARRTSHSPGHSIFVSSSTMYPRSPANRGTKDSFHFRFRSIASPTRSADLNSASYGHKIAWEGLEKPTGEKRCLARSPTSPWRCLNSGSLVFPGSWDACRDRRFRIGSACPNATDGDGGEALEIRLGRVVYPAE